MLELPSNWQSCSTAYVVRELLRQADAIDRYPEASRAMTRASLEFMLSGPRWADRHERVSLMPHPMGWCINKWLFYVLPRVDDEWLPEIADLPQFRCDVDLLAPPWAERFVRHAVDAILPRYHVDVYSIDRYLDQRILWTSLDMNMPHSEALMDLLQRYARLVQTTPELGVQPVDSE